MNNVDTIPFQWVSTDKQLPPKDFIDGDYGGWIESKPVLVVTSKGDIRIAKFQYWVDFSPKWVQVGGEISYYPEDIKFWAPLDDFISLIPKET